jgi:hypothetical protein
MLKLGADGDYSLWYGHLQLEVGVIGDRHEFRICWPPEDRVVRSRKANGLEGVRFLAEISLIAEGDR